MRKLLILAALFLCGLTTANAPAANFNGGTTNCPASGAARIVSTSTRVSWWIIQTPDANGNNVGIGGPTVSISGGVVSNGIKLLPGASLNSPPQSNAQVFDLQTIWFICGTSTDKINFIYAQ